MIRKTVELKIRRQDSPKAESRWEEFSIVYRENMNVIICLMEIRRNPTTKTGHRTTPVAWECSCLEEICGSCTMVINGKVRQACSALVDKLEQPISIAPMSKFPLIRDLIVDRSVMFENLKRVKAWVPIDGTHDLGAGQRIDPDTAAKRYELSKCMTCGCCLEACPQVNERSSFVGAAIINAVELFNSHPVGANLKGERLDAVMSEGGIADCGNAQNCVQVCPKSIPLVESIAKVNKDVSKEMFFSWLKK